MTHPRIAPSLAALGAALLGLAAILAACGGSSAKSAQSTSTAGTSASTGDARTPGGRFANRTPPPEIQTSIAQGTPAPAFGGNRTLPPAILTSIAEGTPPPAFGNRTPSAANLTAIAQGTPASALRGFRGGARIIGDLAVILGVDETALRSELQAPNASIESVAAAHGVERATIRQKLIDAVRQRLDAAVAAGMMTQQMADDQASQFASNIDRTLDEVGGAPGVFDATPPTP